MKIEQRMSSKEIADLTGKRHDHVMRDVKNMYSELDLGVPKFGGTYYSKQHKSMKCYLLPRREVEILITGYSIKLRAKVVDRLREVEQELASQSTQPQIEAPKNYKQALIALIEAEEVKEQQQLIIQKQAPAVEFCNQISVSKGSMKIGDFAKVLCTEGFKIGQNRLFDYLRTNNILMDNNTPYQRYIDNGYFEVSMGITNGYPWTTTKITGKGQLALANKLRG